MRALIPVLDSVNALPAVRHVLQLTAPAEVTTEPLPPLPSGLLPR